MERLGIRLAGKGQRHSCFPLLLQVTGITDEMLAGPEAVDMNEALSEFVGFVDRQITGETLKGGGATR